MGIKDRNIISDELRNVDMAGAIDPSRTGPIGYVSPEMLPRGKPKPVKGCKMYIEDIERIRKGN